MELHNLRFRGDLHAFFAAFSISFGIVKRSPYDDGSSIAMSDAELRSIEPVQDPHPLAVDDGR
jgi:hypothetical protein